MTYADLARLRAAISTQITLFLFMMSVPFAIMGDHDTANPIAYVAVCVVASSFLASLIWDRP